MVASRTADAQRFVQLAAVLEHVGDLPLGNGHGAHITQSLEYGQRLFPADTQRLVQLAAVLEHVGDPALGDSHRARIAEALIAG